MGLNRMVKRNRQRVAQVLIDAGAVALPEPVACPSCNTPIFAGVKHPSEPAVLVECAYVQCGARWTLRPRGALSAAWVKFWTVVLRAFGKRVSL